MPKETESRESNIETMMAEDYLALGKYEKAVEMFKKIGKEMPKEKLEAYAKVSLARGDIKDALNALKIAGTDEEMVKTMFTDHALKLLDEDLYIDFEKFQEILKAVGVKPAENEKLSRRLTALAKKKMGDSVTAQYILDIYIRCPVLKFRESKLSKWL